MHQASQTPCLFDVSTCLKDGVIRTGEQFDPTRIIARNWTEAQKKARRLKTEEINALRRNADELRAELEDCTSLQKRIRAQLSEVRAEINRLCGLSFRTE